MPETWAGRSKFDYKGSVATGTTITYGKGHSITITSQQYSSLRRHFINRVVPIGTSRTEPPTESLGAWLKENVTETAIASYVGPILVIEKYAEKIGRSNIKVLK